MRDRQKERERWGEKKSTEKEGKVEVTIEEKEEEKIRTARTIIDNNKRKKNKMERDGDEDYGLIH